MVAAAARLLVLFLVLALLALLPPGAISLRPDEKARTKKLERNATVLASGPRPHDGRGNLSSIGSGLAGRAALQEVEIPWATTANLAAAAGTMAASVDASGAAIRLPHRDPKLSHRRLWSALSAASQARKDGKLRKQQSALETPATEPPLESPEHPAHHDAHDSDVFSSHSLAPPPEEADAGGIASPTVVLLAAQEAGGEAKNSVSSGGSAELGAVCRRSGGRRAGCRGSCKCLWWEACYRKIRRAEPFDDVGVCELSTVAVAVITLSLFLVMLLLVIGIRLLLQNRDFVNERVQASLALGSANASGRRSFSSRLLERRAKMLMAANLRRGSTRSSLSWGSRSSEGGS